MFRLSAGPRSVTLLLRDGLVSEEFVDLARAPARSADQERRLTALKQQLADRVMARPAGEVCELVPPA